MRLDAGPGRCGTYVLCSPCGVGGLNGAQAFVMEMQDSSSSAQDHVGERPSVYTPASRRTRLFWTTSSPELTLSA